MWPSIRNSITALAVAFVVACTASPAAAEKRSLPPGTIVGAGSVCFEKVTIRSVAEAFSVGEEEGQSVGRAYISQGRCASLPNGQQVVLKLLEKFDVYSFADGTFAIWKARMMSDRVVYILLYDYDGTNSMYEAQYDRVIQDQERLRQMWETEKARTSI